MRPLWKTIRHRLEVFSMRIFVAGVPRLSRDALLAWADFLGNLIFDLDHRGRQVALANLETAFGDGYLPGERREIARQSFRNLARTFLDLFWAGNLTRENFRVLIDVEGWDSLVAARKDGRGTMLYSAHLGNFEFVPLSLNLLGEFPVSVVQDIKNPAITPFFEQARSVHGASMIPQRLAILKMVRALKRGGLCGMLVDLTVKLDQPGHLVNAFGRKKWITATHVALARSTDSHLIPLTVLPLPGGRYRMKIMPEAVTDLNLGEQEVAQICWDVLEKEIREHPECWLWNYKHWRYRPEGAEDYPFYAQSSSKFQKVLREKEKS